MALSPTALNEMYQPLETACGDVRRYTFISAALGCLIIVTAALAATVSSVFLALIAFAYFPFATAFLLSQHLMGLRLLRADTRWPQRCGDERLSLKFASIRR